MRQFSSQGIRSAASLLSYSRCALTSIACALLLGILTNVLVSKAAEE